MLIQYQNYAIPIEVKAGKSGALKSLEQFMKQTGHPYALSFYAGDLKITDAVKREKKPYKLLNLPYYLAGKTNSYLDWFIDRA